MTTRQIAGSMRRLADALDKLPEQPFTKGNPPQMSAEMQVGGLIALHYLIDMVTAGNREIFDRPTLLVLLDTCAKDADMFQQGLYTQVKSAFTQDDEDPESTHGVRK